MAGNPLFGEDGLIATTLQHYMRNLQDQVFKATPLLYLLGGEGSPASQSGRTIVQELLFGDQESTGFYVDDDVFDAPSRNGVTAAEYPWRNYHGSVFFTGEEMAKNQGPEAAVSLLKARITQVERTIAKEINAALHTGSGDNSPDAQEGFYGLADIINNSATFGGIDRSDGGNAWWRASVLSGATPITRARMTTAYNNVTDGSDKPTHILTTQAGFEAYEGFLTDQTRYMDTKLGDAGFDNLVFKSTPILWDRDCVSGSMYFLNMNFIDLIALSGEWFTASEWLKPVNQDAQYKNIILRGNVSVSNSALQGAIVGATNA